MIQLIDIIGIAAFSIAGAFAAMERKLDIFGILVIAFITALGGGTLRDILIGQVPVRWMYDLKQDGVVLVSTVVVLVFTNPIRNLSKILLLFDSLGLAFFTVVGIQQGLSIGLHPVVCVILGTITACFGGVIRDIALNNIPLIFQKEIYATACMFGGVIYFLLMKVGVGSMAREVICVAVIIVVRLLAVQYKWKLVLPERKK